MKPTAQAAITLAEYNTYLGELPTTTFRDELAAQCASASKGDMSRAEAILVAQAHTLDGVFHHMARKAARCEYVAHSEVYLRLALKAQSQCRATLATLAAMKNPQPVAFVRQANISHGPQQVNNGAASVHGPAEINQLENSQNKLLELQNEPRLDFRTAGAPSGAYSAVATMDALDGPKNGRR